MCCPCGYYSTCWRSCTPAYIEAVKQTWQDPKEQKEFQKDWKEDRDGSPYV